jgi:PAS domain S-box-containing protein
MSDLYMVPSAVLDAIREGMILADSSGAILLVNREAQDILGRNASELIGQSLEALIAGRHNVTHAVEVRGYLDGAEGQLVQRRRTLTAGMWRGRRLSHNQDPQSASADRRMLIVSLRNLVTYRQAQQVRLYDRRLRTLREIGQAIRAARAPDVAAQTALRHIRCLAPCTQAVVLAFDPEAAQAVVLAAFLNGATPMAAGARLPLDSLKIADARLV